YSPTTSATSMFLAKRLRSPVSPQAPRDDPQENAPVLLGMASFRMAAFRMASFGLASFWTGSVAMASFPMASFGTPSLRMAPFGLAFFGMAGRSASCRQRRAVGGDVLRHARASASLGGRRRSVRHP